MYRARTSTFIVLLILATVPLHTVAATDGTNNNAAASEAYERAVLQAQRQVMMPNLSIASVAPDNDERATLAAEGQVFVHLSAQAALSGG